ncbi:MAG: hypothetical protein V4539_00800 [Bacteroidota bacterium]
MQKITGFLFTCIIGVISTVSSAQNNTVPVWDASMNKMPSEDWLVKPVNAHAQIFHSTDNKDIILYNGLVKRVFRLSPNLVCIDYTNMINGRQMLRAVTPEARLTINNKKYNVGGLYGQKERAYLLPEWLDKFKASDSDFHYVSYTVTDIPPYIHWQTKTWASNTQQPKGKMISFLYRSTVLKELVVKVNYELYDGLPLIVKWIQVINPGNAVCKLNRVVSELLATVEEESSVIGTGDADETQRDDNKPLNSFPKVSKHHRAFTLKQIMPLTMRCVMY